MIPIGMLLEVGSKILDKVLPDPEAKARAQVALMEMQQKGELAQIQADMNEQDNLTKRAEADMKSDSWLSKNIRPMTLDLHPNGLPSPCNYGRYGARHL
jgi:uncharacterized membrane protein (DUF106 family)